MMIKQLPENHTAIHEKAEGDTNSYVVKSGIIKRHLVKSLAGGRKRKTKNKKESAGREQSKSHVEATILSM